MTISILFLVKSLLFFHVRFSIIEDCIKHPCIAERTLVKQTPLESQKIKKWDIASPPKNSLCAPSHLGDLCSDIVMIAPLSPTVLQTVNVSLNNRFFRPVSELKMYSMVSFVMCCPIKLGGGLWDGVWSRRFIWGTQDWPLQEGGDENEGGQRETLAAPWWFWC